MLAIANGLFSTMLLIGFASWVVAFYSQIGILGNMKAGFWKVMLHSHWLLFKKEKLQLNGAGEIHHARLVMSLKVFLASLIFASIIEAAIIGLKVK